MNAIEKQLLYEVTKRISEKIESEFKTIVNSYGVIHISESEYKNICGRYNHSHFSWVCYFVIPVECDYELVLPQYYWDETKEFRGTESFFECSFAIPPSRILFKTQIL